MAHKGLNINLTLNISFSDTGMKSSSDRSDDFFHILNFNLHISNFRFQIYSKYCTHRLKQYYKFNFKMSPGGYHKIFMLNPNLFSVLFETFFSIKLHDNSNDNWLVRECISTRMYGNRLLALIIIYFSRKNTA